MNRQKIKVLAVIFALCFLSFSCIVFLTDNPVTGSKRKGFYGAIAIRDNVNDFQKMGTCLFTRAYLQRYYDNSYYYTQNSYEEHREDFIAKLTQLLQENDSVDVFLLAHTNYYCEWIRSVDPALRKKIHLVYNTGCSGLQQKEIWKELGVSQYVGHESRISISPVFYFFFLRRYLSDGSLPFAVEQSNTAMHEKLARIKKLSLHSLDIPEQVENGSEGTLCSYK
jgi:hypothetical protein